MWYTAILMGLAGSLHCAGMCCPLAMAVTQLTPSAALSRVVYNGGRIFTYGILGGVFSLVNLLLPLTRYTNILSVAFGVVLVVLAFSRFNVFTVPGVGRHMAWFHSVLRRRFSFLLTRKNQGSMFALGMLNGMLPCGLTFVALSYCVLLPGPQQGMAYMVFFGVGTLPVMLGLTSLVFVAIKKFNISFQNVTTGMLVVSGLLLIGRVFAEASIQASHGRGEMIDIVLCR